VSALAGRVGRLGAKFKQSSGNNGSVKRMKKTDDKR